VQGKKIKGKKEGEKGEDLGGMIGEEQGGKKGQPGIKTVKARWGEIKDGGGKREKNRGRGNQVTRGNSYFSGNIWGGFGWGIFLTSLSWS